MSKKLTKKEILDRRICPFINRPCRKKKCALYMGHDERFAVGCVFLTIAERLKK